MNERRNQRILVVDDEPLFLSSVVDVLGREGYPDVATAADGREALQKIQETAFDLIVTDLNMPEMGGVELLAGLSQSSFKGRVMVVSAYLTDETERAVRQLGAVACLEKPIDLEALVDFVATSLAHPESVLDGLTVAGFTQLLEVEGKSCLLRVLSQGRQGDLVFEEGTLVDAVTEDAEGDRAALDILAWNDVVLQIHDGSGARRRRTTMPLSHLLLESVHLADEEAHISASSDSGRAEEASAEGSGAIVDEPVDELPPRTKGSGWMPNVKDSLKELMTIEGAEAVALVDYESGMTLGQLGGGADFDIEVAAAGVTKVVRAKVEVMQALGLDSAIEDILITLGDQYDLIRPLKTAPNLFLYLVLGRRKANLAMSRHKLASIEASLEV